MRTVVSILVAVCINLVLFYAIYRMVTSTHTEIHKGQDVSMVQFVRLQHQPQTPEQQHREQAPKKPPPPETPPPPPKLNVSAPAKPKVQQMRMPQPDLNIPMQVAGGPYLGGYQAAPKAPPAPAPSPPGPPGPPPIEENVVPTFRVPPVYPPRAQRAGIEGVVTVEFTIATDGTVKDPKVVKADPPNIFNRAVLSAIRQWKFKPKTVDGKAVARRARQVIRFTLGGR